MKIIKIYLKKASGEEDIHPYDLEKLKEPNFIEKLLNPQ